MRYTQQQNRRNDDYEEYRNYDNYERYRNYDDIEAADHERDGHGRSGGRGGMGRRYELSEREFDEGYADFSDDEVGYSQGRRGSMQRPSYQNEDRAMRSTGDRRASHDREFERDYDRKFDRGSGYPLRRPEHEYNHSQERYSASHSRPHPSRLPR